MLRGNIMRREGKNCKEEEAEGMRGRAPRVRRTFKEAREKKGRSDQRKEMKQQRRIAGERAGDENQCWTRMSE